MTFCLKDAGNLANALAYYLYKHTKYRIKVSTFYDGDNSEFWIFNETCPGEIGNILCLLNVINIDKNDCRVGMIIFDSCPKELHDLIFKFNNEFDIE